MKSKVLEKNSFRAESSSFSPQFLLHHGNHGFETLGQYAGGLQTVFRNDKGVGNIHVQLEHHHRLLNLGKFEVIGQCPDAGKRANLKPIGINVLLDEMVLNFLNRFGGHSGKYDLIYGGFGHIIVGSIRGSDHRQRILGRLDPKLSGGKLTDVVVLFHLARIDLRVTHQAFCRINGAVRLQESVGRVLREKVL